MLENIIKLYNADELVVEYKQYYNRIQNGNITPTIYDLDDEVNAKLFKVA